MRSLTQSSTLRDWDENDVMSRANHADNSYITASMRDVFPSQYTRYDAGRYIRMATSSSKNLFLAIDLDGEAV
ncbi:MAG: hypothetical protein WCF90_06640 [Methanomicrobiales archaeon]